MTRYLFRCGTIVDPVMGRVDTDLVVADGQILDVGTGLDGDEAVDCRLDSASRHAVELIFDELIGGPGDLDGTLETVRFHAACGIDRVPLQVVDELAGTDNAGHERARIDSDPERSTSLFLASEPSRRRARPTAP